AGGRRSIATEGACDRGRPRLGSLPRRWRTRLDEGDSIRRHLADHSDRESRTGKRLTLRDPHAERPGNRTDLVLVEVAQRFDELQLHVLREAADIMVGLDPVPELAPALDPVRGDRPLDQMVGPKGLRLSLEELDEHAADDGPFLLRVDDASQRPEEFVRGVDDPMPPPAL